ncbi:MAG: dihydroneopterin aldolase [Clostridia bacterium]|nr:dihydroneopterin aldolase [Clostridia bacterium]
MDKIIINDLRIFAYHGVNVEEKIHGQNYDIDITAEVDLSAACRSDDLDDTVSYSRIIKRASYAFTAEKYDLIEKAAQEIADTLLSDFEKIKAVEVTVRKPDAPIRADFGYVAVFIRRERHA